MMADGDARHAADALAATRARGCMPSDAPARSAHGAVPIVVGVLGSRIVRVATLAFGVGAIFVIGGVVVSRLPSRAQGPAVQSGVIANGRLPVGTLLDKPVPDLRLIDERGHATSLGDFRGRYLVLAPSLTLCHEVCPMTTAALEQIRATLDRDGIGGDVTVATASVDPWRDKPARLRAYSRLTGVNFRLLTGTPRELARMWKFFGVYYRRVPQGKPADVDWLTHKPETFDVEHTDGLFIIDPGGHWRVALTGMPSVGKTLAPRLRRLLNHQGISNLRHPQAPWTPAQAVGDVLDVRQREDQGQASVPKPAAPPSPAAARAALAGSPPTLASLHSQAGALLGGGEHAFKARLASLRGRPVVVNEWASWCFPCRNEFPLLARAASTYGKRVAFLGLNVSDHGDAAGFLRRHPVSYPSYSDPNGTIAQSFGNAQALPITVYIGPDGRVDETHFGVYSAQQALDSDIERYALGR
jgi:cytochrome c biogenesis protein CcmG, thiol:disulfide interchange protein DsbE